MKKILYILIVLAILSSCGVTTKVIEVPVKSTEYIHEKEIDSIFIKDSTMNIVRRDTVFVYRERVKREFLFKTDTIIQRDSIPYVVEVPKIQKVYCVRWYQRILMWIGGIAAITIGAYIFFKIKLK